MSTQDVDPHDLMRVLRRNVGAIVLSLFLCGALAVEVAFYIPRSYKSKALLTIQASYFQNPLVSDFIREVGDPAEQAAQRYAILRMALSEQFLDELGTKYDVFKYPVDHRWRVLEREGLLKRIEYYSTAPTTFYVAVVANDPVVAFEMTRDVLEQMKRTLYEQRLGNLIRTRDAILKHIQTLRFTLKDITSPIVSLKIKLEKIQADIQTLTSQFSERHPEVSRLQKQAESIQSLIKNFSAKNDPQSDDSPQAVLNMSSKQTSEEVFNDLLRKLNYLNIVLDMEKDPENLPYLGIIEQPTIPTGSFAPDKKLFFAFGLAAGLALAAVLIIYRELKSGTFSNPYHLSTSVGIPFLGELPTMEGGKALLALSAPPASSRKSLPSPGQR